MEQEQVNKQVPQIVERCSSLPLHLQCPAPLFSRNADGEVTVVSASEPAEMGHCVHDVLAHIVAKDLDDVPDLAPWAAKWFVDANELSFLAWSGLKAWRALKKYFPNPVVELPMKATWVGDDTRLTLTGHGDVVSESVDDKGADVIAALDWKSGRLDNDFYDQLAGYGCLARRHSGKVNARVMAVVVNLREGTFRVWKWTGDEMDRWEAQMVDTLAHWDGVYRTGGHCRLCPVSASCPALKQIVHQSAQMLLMDGGQSDLSFPEKVLETYQKVQIIEKRCEDFREAVKLLVRGAGGRLEGAGKALTILQQEKSHIDPLKAWPVLAGVMSEAELAGCVKIQKKAMEDTVMARAERGQKKAAKESLLARLNEAGAVTKEAYETMRVVRLDEAEGKESSAGE